MTQRYLLQKQPTNNKRSNRENDSCQSLLTKKIRLVSRAQTTGKIHSFGGHFDRITFVGTVLVVKNVKFFSAGSFKLCDGWVTQTKRSTILWDENRRRNEEQKK